MSSMATDTFRDCLDLWNRLSVNGQSQCQGILSQIAASTYGDEMGSAAEPVVRQLDTVHATIRNLLGVLDSIIDCVSRAVDSSPTASSASVADAAGSRLVAGLLSDLAGKQAVELTLQQLAVNTLAGGTTSSDSPVSMESRLGVPMLQPLRCISCEAHRVLLSRWDAAPRSSDAASSDTSADTGTK